MKTPTLLLLGSLLALAPTAGAQTVSAAERQQLARDLNQLLRDPRKPHQEVELAFTGCHVQQTIRDNKANVQLSEPVNVSVSKGSSDWAVKASNGRFELQMGFEWPEVTALSYQATTDDSTPAYELQVKRQGKNATTTTSMTLYTTDEALVQRLVRRLEALRQSCH